MTRVMARLCQSVQDKALIFTNLEICFTISDICVIQGPSPDPTLPLPPCPLLNTSTHSDPENSQQQELGQRHKAE